jgi:predicted DNA-binding transcriptional regulator YafY
MAKRASGMRKRPAVHISLGRAARLYRLVVTLAGGEKAREDLLAELGTGLRTFYRELELLRRCGVKIRLERRRYRLVGTAQEAEGRLPFPDPQLSFAELAELAQGPGPAARRLAELFESVIGQSRPPAPGPGRRGRRMGKASR